MKIKIVERRDGKGSDYYHEESERYFQRIVGGIVAPSAMPGAVVVVGEEKAIRPPFRLFVLVESRATTLDDLFSKTLEFQGDYQVQGFYGRKSDVVLWRYLSIFNRGQVEKRLASLQIEAAPYTTEGDIISVHVSILRSLLLPGKKTLHLGASGRLPNALKELSQSELSTASSASYPLVAALGYAVSVLSEQLYQDPSFRKPRTSKTDYDVLSYGQ